MILQMMKNEDIEWYINLADEYFGNHAAIDGSVLNGLHILGKDTVETIIPWTMNRKLLLDEKDALRSWGISAIFQALKNSIVKEY